MGFSRFSDSNFVRSEGSKHDRSFSSPVVRAWQCQKPQITLLNSVSKQIGVYLDKYKTSDIPLPCLDSVYFRRLKKKRKYDSIWSYSKKEKEKCKWIELDLNQTRNVPELYKTGLHVISEIAKQLL